jgi:hypothetical protein
MRQEIVLINGCNSLRDVKLEDDIVTTDFLITQSLIVRHLTIVKVTEF